MYNNCVLEDTCILCIYFLKNKDHKLVFNSSISFLKLAKKKILIAIIAECAVSYSMSRTFH